MLVLVVGCGRLDFDDADYADVVLSDHPLGYWRLDESAGTVAHDSSPSHLLGTYFGTVTLGATGALTNDPDRAAAFDGVSESYVDTNGHYDVSGTAPISIEAWIAPTTIDTTFRHVFTDQHRPSIDKSGVALLVHSPAGIAFERFVAGAGLAADAPRASEGRYSYVVGTYDGATMSLYVDGQLVDSQSDARPAPAIVETALIGESSAGEGYLFDGSIDEVAVYGYALSIKRIQTHFAAGAGRAPN